MLTHIREWSVINNCTVNITIDHDGIMLTVKHNESKRSTIIPNYASNIPTYIDAELERLLSLLLAN